MKLPAGRMKNVRLRIVGVKVVGQFPIDPVGDVFRRLVTAAFRIKRPEHIKERRRYGADLFRIRRGRGKSFIALFISGGQFFSQRRVPGKRPPEVSPVSGDIDADDGLVFLGKNGDQIFFHAGIAAAVPGFLRKAFHQNRFVCDAAFPHFRAGFQINADLRRVYFILIKRRQIGEKRR